MNLKTILAAAIVISFAAPAMADEYYIVREPHTKHCKIVITKPTEETTITQIGPLAFKTHKEAENRLKSVKVCHED